MLDIDTIKNYKYNINFRINLHEELVNYKKDSTTIIFFNQKYLNNIIL